MKNNLLSAKKLTNELCKRVGKNISDEIYDLFGVYGQYRYRWKKDIPWKGYDVYDAIFKGRKLAIIGLPSYILVNDEEARVSTPGESLEYLNYQVAHNIANR